MRTQARLGTAVVAAVPSLITVRVSLAWAPTAKQLACLLAAEPAGKALDERGGDVVARRGNGRRGHDTNPGHAQSITAGTPTAKLRAGPPSRCSAGPWAG